MSEVYHSGDLDAMLELARSKGYALMEQRIHEELERHRTAMENARGEELLIEQGQVKAWRTVLRIPAILQDEIKGSLKE